jgi:hypothetical protein
MAVSERGNGLSNGVPRGRSIHELSPIETGGIEARKGFGFQDHVAAGFCIDKLTNPYLTQVWCETQDDITLIWDDEPGERVEFVQVKGNEPDQLWSISLLCQRDTKKKPADRVGTSILERSLTYDRCSEPCCFRIVTAMPVKEELKILTYAIESSHRQNATDEIEALKDKIAIRVGDYSSSNGRCCKFWVTSATWHALYSAESVKNRNLLELQRFLKSSGSVVFSDQAEELYNKLLFKVQQAGLARHEASPEAKKLRRDATIAWMRQEVEKIEHPIAPGSGKTLREKMETAGIPSDVIDSAIRLRQQYRMEMLTPHYQELADRRATTREVAGILHLLLSKLDAGKLDESGIAFHSLCLESLGALRPTFNVCPEPDLAFLFGCMYNIADRCGHRFMRTTG